jgi:hypothetical protein
MATGLKYTLQQMNTISCSGFKYEIPQETIDIINYLTQQIGSNTIIKTINFHKRPLPITNNIDEDVLQKSGGQSSNNRKRKGNKAMEVFSDDWETIRNFQATVIEQKTGIDVELSQIRMYLNKLTDKSYLDIREKIVTSINSILQVENDTVLLSKSIGEVIYDISSGNKFYSKIYADLYSELVNKYDWLKRVLDEKICEYIGLFKTIEYFDPDKDYDKFCDMNKKNEKRRANAMFFVNLAITRFIPKGTVINMLKTLLEMVLELIEQPNKKNEVDEITETIALLFNKDMMEHDYNESEFMINGKTIEDNVTILAKSKSKDYKSLSNKAIFKYMDLIEI